jgi:hypothetical protein
MPTLRPALFKWRHFGCVAKTIQSAKPNQLPWRMDHGRKTSITVRNVAASTPALMRSRSPVANTSSRAASVAGFCRGAPLSTKAKRTGSFFWSRLRQA